MMLDLNLKPRSPQTLQIVAGSGMLHCCCFFVNWGEVWRLVSTIFRILGAIFCRVESNVDSVVNRTQGTEQNNSHRHQGVVVDWCSQQGQRLAICSGCHDKSTSWRTYPHFEYVSRVTNFNFTSSATMCKGSCNHIISQLQSDETMQKRWCKIFHRTSLDKFAKLAWPERNKT